MLIAAIPLSLWVAVPIYGAVFGFVFAASLPWLYHVDQRIAASRRLKPLLLCGQMCYSLYLVHQIPVKAVTSALARSGATDAVSTLLLAVPLSIGVSVSLGWLFHISVEQRFLNTPARELDHIPNTAVAAPA